MNRSNDAYVRIFLCVRIPPKESGTIPLLLPLFHQNEGLVPRMGSFRSSPEDECILRMGPFGPYLYFCCPSALRHTVSIAADKCIRTLNFLLVKKWPYFLERFSKISQDSALKSYFSVARYTPVHHSGTPSSTSFPQRFINTSEGRSPWAFQRFSKISRPFKTLPSTYSASARSNSATMANRSFDTSPVLPTNS